MVPRGRLTSCDRYSNGLSLAAPISGRAEHACAVNPRGLPSARRAPRTAAKDNVLGVARTTEREERVGRRERSHRRRRESFLNTALAHLPRCSTVSRVLLSNVRAAYVARGPCLTPPPATAPHAPYQPHDTPVPRVARVQSEDEDKPDLQLEPGELVAETWGGNRYSGNWDGQALVTESSLSSQRLLNDKKRHPAPYHVPERSEHRRERGHLQREPRSPLYQQRHNMWQRGPSDDSRLHTPLEASVRHHRGVYP